MKILIVEPSTQIRERFYKLFQYISNVDTIKMLSNPNNLMEAALSMKPDVVIFDVLMFGFEGIDFIKKIKKALPNLVVIILSDFLFPKYVERCLEAGADFFFDKLYATEKIPQLLEAGSKSRQKQISDSFS